jgi:hypothetical protein
LQRQPQKAEPNPAILTDSGSPRLECLVASAEENCRDPQRPPGHVRVAASIYPLMAGFKEPCSVGIAGERFQGKMPFDFIG